MFARTLTRAPSRQSRKPAVGQYAFSLPPLGRPTSRFGLYSVMVRPYGTAVRENRRHPARLERHDVAPRGRQSLLWMKLADSPKGQAAIFHAHEVHATEADACGAAGVIGKDNLIGG